MALKVNTSPRVSVIQVLFCCDLAPVLESNEPARKAVRKALYNTFVVARGMACKADADPLDGYGGRLSSAGTPGRRVPPGRLRIDCLQILPSE